jgi:hypothetical protein
MFFWAVVSHEINRVIEFFPTRWQAERMLAKVLWEEPGWQGVLRVEKDRVPDGNGELGGFGGKSPLRLGGFDGTPAVRSAAEEC